MAQLDQADKDFLVFFTFSLSLNTLENDLMGICNKLQDLKVISGFQGFLVKKEREVSWVKRVIVGVLVLKGTKGSEDLWARLDLMESQVAILLNNKLKKPLYLFNRILFR